MALLRKQPGAAATQLPPGSHAELLPALRAVLKLIPKGDYEHFEAFFLAADTAIDALGELDFSEYEREEIGSADLSVWEALAPVIRDTIVDVNKLLTVVKQEIPEEPVTEEAGSDDAFDDAFGGGGEAAPKEKKKAAGPADPRKKVKDAQQIIHAIAGALAKEVTAFGEGIRKPVVMADRWNLLAHLGEFRGKFRAGIGEMVFLGASAFSPVRKDQVVPRYREETEDAAALRRTLAVLASVVRAENEKLQAEDP